MIVRVNKRERYSVISNVPLEDSELSWAATGLLAYLLSKPNHWEVRVEDLATRKTNGKHAVRGLLKELEQAGYIKRERERNGAGAFVGISTAVYEEPIERAPHRGFPHVDNPHVGNPRVENRTLVITKEEVNTEEEVITDFRDEKFVTTGDHLQQPQSPVLNSNGTGEHEKEAEIQSEEKTPPLVARRPPL